jgi:hypothetical protein
VTGEGEETLSKDEEEERKAHVAEKLEKFMCECGDLIYERDLQQLFLCSFKKNKTEDLKYIFCSEVCLRMRMVLFEAGWVNLRFALILLLLLLLLLIIIIIIIIIILHYVNIYS